jgi:hypothetical protein
MVNAIVVEALVPETPRARVRPQSATERDYYCHRAAEEAKAANAASCGEARIAHEKLAAAYRLLCSSRQGWADPHLASEPAMFQFNPHPRD